jgi:hypothetical protein
LILEVRCPEDYANDLCSFANAKLPKQLLQNSFDRPFGTLQILGNLLIGPSIRDEAEDGLLARREGDGTLRLTRFQASLQIRVGSFFAASASLGRDYVFLRALP